MVAEPENRRPLRADAERNRLRILDAAAEVFAQRGLQASLDDVAHRAGVGVGTVYRRFPDREALVTALFEARVEEFLQLAAEARHHPDPWEGLKLLLERGAEFNGRNRALRELLFTAPAGREWVDVMRARMGPLAHELVQAAQAQGKLRSDLETYDVPLTMLMLASAIEVTHDTAADNWRRLLGIVLDGLATSRKEPTALDAKALTQEEFLQAMMRSGRR